MRKSSRKQTSHATDSSAATSRPRIELDAIARLQRTIGNRALMSAFRSRHEEHVANANDNVQTLTAFPAEIQLKSNDSSHDPYEREADRAANHVMRMSEPYLPPDLTHPANGALTLRPNTREIQHHDGDLQRNPELSPLAHNVVQSSGQPLHPTIRAFTEPRFGADFSRVRVHTDARAAEASSSISARAFTLGHDIVFGAGEYVPQTESGRQLISHELAHVVQQTGNAQSTRVPMVGRSWRAIQRQKRTTKVGIAEKVQTALTLIYQREMIGYPTNMRTALDEWVMKMAFPTDAVDKPLMQLVLQSLNKNLAKFTITKILDLIPNPILKEALKLGVAVAENVVTDLTLSTKNWARLSEFWASLSRSYDHARIIGENNQKKFSDSVTDFKNKLANRPTDEQSEIHDVVAAQLEKVEATNSANAVDSLFLYFSALYMNSATIKTPPSEKATLGGAKQAFLILNYNVDASPGVLGERNGEYRFFSNPTSKAAVTKLGFRYINNDEILGVFPELDTSTIWQIWKDLFLSGHRRGFTASLYAPLAEQLKDTLYHHTTGVLDTAKVGVRRRLMLNYYAMNVDFDGDGNEIGTKDTYDYARFYWKIMWKTEGFPKIQKNRMEAYDA